MDAMTQEPEALELEINLLLDAPREKLFRAWRDPDLLRQWFAPAPWSIAGAELDFRPGGTSRIVMKSPEGQQIPMEGVYLEIVENEKIVTTDAYGEDWAPADHPFFTAIVTFEDEGNKTRYRARARHWRREDHDRHEQMGFKEGWTQCARQLESLAKELP